jgi:hypothetical protein
MIVGSASHSVPSSRSYIWYNFGQVYEKDKKEKFMRILAIGAEYKHPSVTTARFRSEVSFLDFDVVIWDPNYLGSVDI